MRYFFDFREGDSVLTDEMGVDFVSPEAAKADASKALASLAAESVSANDSRELSVEVRTSERPVFVIRATFEVQSF